MQSQTTYRALVVDDIPLVRRLTIGALSNRFFECQGASNGVEAQLLLESGAFDVVVTDLKMPRQHGHALAVELLSRDCCPAIVVLTAVMDQRLTNDLLARGVDHVEYKPVDYSSFAETVHSIVRRKKALLERQYKFNRRIFSDQTSKEKTDATPERVSLPDLLSRLEIMSRLLPVSDAALNVYQMTRSIEYDFEQLAAAIQRDPSLTTEVLRLANSPFYNATGCCIDRLEQAIGRIGQRRLGELALVMQSLNAMRSQTLSWMNSDAVWRTSIATGVAAEMLLEASQIDSESEGLLLAGTMYPLGRLALATAYPDRYRLIVSECLRRGEPMQAIEASVFPEDHAKVLVRLLERWNLPSALYEPIRSLLEPYEAVQLLPSELRDKVLLLKVARLIAQVATRSWEPWDLVEIPPPAAFRQFVLADLSGLIENVRRDTEAICAFNVDPDAPPPARSVPPAEESPLTPIDYIRLGHGSPDLFEHVLRSMRLEPLRRKILSECGEHVVVNANDVRDVELLSSCDEVARRHSLVAANTGSKLAGDGALLAMPCSFKRLRDAVADHLAKSKPAPAT